MLYKLTHEEFYAHDSFSELLGTILNGAATLLEFFETRVAQSPESPMFGQINEDQEVEHIKYKEVDYCVDRFGDFLKCITTPRENVGICSVNRPEWLIAEFGIYKANCVNVPIHVNFDANALSYIFFLTKLRTVIVSSVLAEGIIKKLQSGLLKDKICLKTIIIMDYDQKVFDKCVEAGFETFSMDQVLFCKALVTASNLNFTFDSRFCSTSNLISKAKYFFSGYNGCKEFEQPFCAREKPKPEDIASYCFTSGTSGPPKGVKLTHSNFIYQLEGYAIGSEHHGIFKVDSNDVYMSYLPLSHVLERVCVFICIMNNANICFYRGVREKFILDIQIIKPTFIPTVPLVLRNFFEKIEAAVAEKSYLLRKAYKMAVNHKIKNQKHGIYDSPMLDKIFFKKVRDTFGGKLRGCLCGGASIDPYIISYLQAVLNARIFQGYGQTEGLGANILCSQYNYDPSTVGWCFPTTKIKLVKYDTEKSSKGKPAEMKLLIKGPSVTSGYLQPTESDYLILDTFEEYKNVRKGVSEEIFDEDGYLITGDIVTSNNSSFFIVGRDKDLLKLDNGEYISLEDIENKLQVICKFEELFLTKSVKGKGLTACIGVVETDIEESSVINKLNDTFSKLLAQNSIPKNVRIEYVAVTKGFQKKNYPSMYTPKETKKRFVSTNSKFYTMIANAVPNVIATNDHDRQQ